MEEKYYNIEKKSLATALNWMGFNFMYGQIEKVKHYMDLKIQQDYIKRWKGY